MTHMCVQPCKTTRRIPPMSEVSSEYLSWIGPTVQCSDTALVPSSVLFYFIWGISNCRVPNTSSSLLCFSALHVFIAHMMVVRAIQNATVRSKHSSGHTKNTRSTLVVTLFLTTIKPLWTLTQKKIVCIVVNFLNVKKIIIWKFMAPKFKREIKTKCRASD